MQTELKSLINKEIDLSGGALSFADFMRLALYTPDLGYYMRQRSPFSQSGDFITAPLLTPLFGQVIAKALANWLVLMPETACVVTELGAGTGALAAAILPVLSELLSHHKVDLKAYYILELSGARRAEQYAYLKEQLPASLFYKVEWLDALPAKKQGVLIANEVLDAIPVHRVRYHEHGMYELCVSYDVQHATYAEVERAIDGSRFYDSLLLEQAKRYIPEIPYYTSELHLEAEGLIRSLCDGWNQGVMLWIDYGFEASVFYHPERSEGTLRVHQQHKSHDAWWCDVGDVDITAHVNFEGIAESAAELGWQCEGFMSQASFLLGAGILERLMTIQSTVDTQECIKQQHAVQQLLSPAEMGELFQVLVLSNGFPDAVWMPALARG